VPEFGVLCEFPNFVRSGRARRRAGINDPAQHQTCTRRLGAGGLSCWGFLGIILATKAPQQVFDFLVSSTGAVVIFVYIITASAQIKLRNDRRREGRADPAVTMWLFPWLSYATIAGMGMVLIAMASTPSLQLDFKLSCVTLALVIIAYWSRRFHSSAGRCNRRQ
jgi:L-asparagine transporter-like permease